MDKVYIVTIDYERGSTHIERVFDSFDMASSCAHSVIKELDKPSNGYIWERKVIRAGDTETIVLYFTNTITFKESFYAYISVKAYPVLH